MIVLFGKPENLVLCRMISWQDIQYFVWLFHQGFFVQQKDHL